MNNTSYTDQTVEQLQGLLADREELWVHECNHPEIGGDCQGKFCSGKRWLLRKPCKHHVPSFCALDWVGCKTYVFNDATDSVPDAIAAMGWAYLITKTKENGWVFASVFRWVEGEVSKQGECREDGITSLTHALMVALLRALDNQLTEYCCDACKEHGMCLHER